MTGCLLPLAEHAAGQWRCVLDRDDEGLRATFSRMPHASYHFESYPAPPGATHAWLVDQLAQVRVAVERADARAAAVRELRRTRVAAAPRLDRSAH